MNNLDCHPSSLVFISSEGRISSKVKDALENDDSVLVLSSLKLWDQFESNHLVKARLPAGSIQTPPNAEDTFDSLIWAKKSFVKDLTLEDWRPMLELFNVTKPRSTLLKYVGKEECSPPLSNPLDKSSSSSSVPKSGKFDFGEASKSAEGFIKDHSAKSTLGTNTTIERLFTSFLKEFYQDSEASIQGVEEEDLPDLLGKFFMSLQKDDGEQYNAGTIQTYYHGLQRVLLEKRKIDIKLDPKYSLVSKILAKKQKVCVEDGQTPGKHRSFAIPPEVLAKGWSQGAFGDQNPSSLLAAIILHLQAKFGTRSNKELYNVTVGDVVIGPLREDRLPSYLSLNERLTKTRRGLKGQGAREVCPKIFPSDSDPARCGVRLFMLYQSKKSPECQKAKAKMFLNVKNVSKRNWSDVPVWYSSSPVGINNISNIVPKALNAIGIDTKGLRITGTSIRKTAVDGSMGSGMDGSLASMIHGHTTLAAKTNYMSLDDRTMKAANKVLHNVITGERAKGDSFHSIFEQERIKEANTVELIKKKEASAEDGKKDLPKQNLSPSSSDSSYSEERLSKKDLLRENQKLLKSLSEMKENLNNLQTSFHSSAALNFHSSAALNFHPSALNFHPSAAPNFHPSAAPNFHPSAAPNFHPSAAPNFHPSGASNFHPSPANIQQNFQPG